MFCSVVYVLISYGFRQATLFELFFSSNIYELCLFCLPCRALLRIFSCITSGIMCLRLLSRTGVRC